MPALSPAARRQAAAHNGEAAASLSALPSSPYYQAPPATVRQVNPNLRMQPQQVCMVPPGWCKLHALTVELLGGLSTATIYL